MASVQSQRSAGSFFEPDEGSVKDELRGRLDSGEKVRRFEES